MRNISLLVAPSEPAIENDLPLDLSCNSRRSTSEIQGEEPLEDCPISALGVHHIRSGGVDRHHRAVDNVGGMGSIGGPPSPPRSPADFRTLELGYVAYHQQLLAKERNRQWAAAQQQQQRNRQSGCSADDPSTGDDDAIESVERDSCSPSGQDSDDSDSQPMDLGPNPKAYKKSLMKRYCKCLIHFFFGTRFLPPFCWPPWPFRLPGILVFISRPRREIPLGTS